MPKNKEHGKDMNMADQTGQMAGREGEYDSNDGISQKLKALYTMTEQEAIPDRFLDLLEQLDAAEQAAKSQDNG